MLVRTRLLNILLSRSKNSSLFILAAIATTTIVFTSCSNSLYVLCKERKIEEIKSQIDKNRKTKDHAEEKIALLREKLYSNQIDLIEKKVKKFKELEKKRFDGKSPPKDDIFFDERKQLTEIIFNSKECGEKAQLVLNDILEIITKLSD